MTYQDEDAVHHDCWSIHVVVKHQSFAFQRASRALPGPQQRPLAFPTVDARLPIVGRSGSDSRRFAVVDRGCDNGRKCFEDFVFHS